MDTSDKRIKITPPPEIASQRINLRLPSEVRSYDKLKIYEDLFPWVKMLWGSKFGIPDTDEFSGVTSFGEYVHRQSTLLCEDLFFESVLQYSGNPRKTIDNFRKSGNTNKAPFLGFLYTVQYFVDRHADKLGNHSYLCPQYLWTRYLGTNTEHRAFLIADTFKAFIYIVTKQHLVYGNEKNGDIALAQIVYRDIQGPNGFCYSLKGFLAYIKDLAEEASHPVFTWDNPSGCIYFKHIKNFMEDLQRIRMEQKFYRR